MDQLKSAAEMKAEIEAELAMFRRDADRSIRDQAQSR